MAWSRRDRARGVGTDSWGPPHQKETCSSNPQAESSMGLCRTQRKQKLNYLKSQEARKSTPKLSHPRKETGPFPGRARPQDQVLKTKTWEAG